MARQRNEVAHRCPSLLLANVRSISNKIDDISTSVLNHRPTVAFFSETWLDDSIPDSAIDIDGYATCRRDRNTNGGGVLFFISSALTFRIISGDDVCSLKDSDTELLALYLPELSTLCIGVYHPFWSEPKKDELATSCILDIIDFATVTLQTRASLRIIVCGDFNDLRKRSDYLCSMACLKPFVDFTTRGSNSLDLIFANFDTSARPRKLPPFGRSDHAAIIWYPSAPQPSTVVKRQVRKCSISGKIAFQKFVDSVDWLGLCSTMISLDDCASVFIQTLMACVNIFFPLRTIRVRSSEFPWMTSSLKILTNDRDRAFSEGKIKKYRLLREKAIRLTWRLKSDYLQKAKSNPKSFWAAARYVGRFPKRNQAASTLSAENFNDYFASTFSCNSYENTTPVFPDTLPDMPLVLSTADVATSLSNIKRKSPGPDGIPYWVLREYSATFAPAVSHIFNRSLSEGSVPICFKEALITPIPKHSNAKEASSFRPISLLPILSKILEKMVAKYWIRPSMTSVSDNQFAYVPLPGRGTTSALSLINNYILKFLDEGSGAVRVLSVDFSKAFDTLPHRTIIDSAIHFSLPRQAVEWIYSFLCDRRQRVNFQDSVSDWCSCVSGVPQGSIIGPLLFCLAIDSLSSVCANSAMIKYADDVTVLHFVRREEDDDLQCEMDNISAWSRSAGLSLNPSKCCCMNIVTKSNLTLRNILDSDATHLPVVSSIKLLGVIFSNDLRWDLHINALCKKACRRFFVLRNMKRSGADSSSLVTLYTALIRPILLYGFECFCNAPERVLKRLKCVENRVLRIIGPKRPEIRGLIPFAEDLCVSLFEKIKKDSSHPLRKLFEDRTPTPRNSNPLRKPRSRTNRFGNSFIKFCR